jgi:peptidoglycan/LPS O-acetylase OafA/YrhL
VQGQTASHRLDVIDGLRGIAILVVVFYHAWLVSGQRLELQLSGVTLSVQFLATTGFLGVDLFFFLSGFCLFYPYVRRHFEGRSPQPLLEYARRRALKIVPSYVVALTVLTLPFHDHFASWLAAAGHYVAHLLFIHPWFAATFDSISGPFWTLGIEVQFYLVFPLIAYLVRSWPIRGYLLILALAEAYRLALIATQHDASFYAVNQLPAFLDIFTGGMVAAYAVVWARNTIPDLARYRIALTAVSLGAFAIAVAALVALASSPAMQSPDAFFEWQSRYRPAIALLLIVLATCSVLAAGHWQRILANPVLLYLSAISYNLYLWHLEILVWGHELNADPRIVVAVSVAASVAAASLFTYAFEQPILKGAWKVPNLRALRPSRLVVLWGQRR